MSLIDQFLIWLTIEWDAVPSRRVYPFSIPAIRKTKRLDFSPQATIFVGENGSGKSTLLEAIALRLGLNAEGGSRNFNFATRETHSDLHEYVRVERGLFRRPQDSFFLRAESLYNVASKIDELGVARGYGGRSLHEQSHGESFMALLTQRFGDNSLYLLDEPEAALSPSRQLAALGAIHHLIRNHCQFVIATHSPILMSLPDAWIYNFSDEGIRRIEYEETEHYQVTRAFLERREMMMRELFDGEDEET